MNSQPRTRLEELVRAAHLSVAEFVARFHRAAAEIGEPIHVSERQAKRWLGGESGVPRGAACRVLEHWWGEPIGQLLGTPATRRAQRPPLALSSAHRVATMEGVIGLAADRAREFGVLAQAMSAEAVGLIRDEVRELAIAGPRSPVTDRLGRLADAQDCAFRLLESRARPADARELYVLCGLACGMLAKASHGLGEPHAAMTQSRTAFICAEQAGHTGLMAWVRGVQSLMTYWDGRSIESVRLARHGTELARSSPGSVRVWLPICEARAQAQQGAASPAFAAVRSAEEAAQSVSADDLDQLADMFFCGPLRTTYYVADVLAWFAPHDPRTLDHAERAVAGYADPTTREWSYGNQAGAHVMLALARTGRGDVDGAAEALAPVLQMPVEQRISGVIASLQRVPAVLPIRASPDLVEQIRQFTRTPATALPR